MTWMDAIEGDFIYLKHFCQHYKVNPYPTRVYLRKILGKRDTKEKNNRWKWKRGHPELSKVDNAMKKFGKGKNDE